MFRYVSLVVVAPDQHTYNCIWPPEVSKWPAQLVAHVASSGVDRSSWVAVAMRRCAGWVPPAGGRACAHAPRPGGAAPCVHRLELGLGADVFVY